MYLVRMALAAALLAFGLAACGPSPNGIDRMDESETEAASSAGAGPSPNGINRTDGSEAASSGGAGGEHGGAGEGGDSGD